MHLQGSQASGIWLWIWDVAQVYSILFCSPIFSNKSLGQATTELTRFKRVIGVDPSAKMLQDAQGYVAKEAPGMKAEFVQSSAEDLAFLKDGSVDLIVGGMFVPSICQIVAHLYPTAQAAHWFDWSKLWPELSRTMRPGGTAAFWVRPMLFSCLNKL